MGGEDPADAGNHPGDDLTPADGGPVEHAFRQLSLQCADAAHLFQAEPQRQPDAEVLEAGVHEVGVDDRAHAADADVQHRHHTDKDDRQRGSTCSTLASTAPPLA